MDLKKSVKIRHANSFFAKLKGLMFERKKNFNYCLIFDMKKQAKFRNSIHMFFVFFPILVLFCDNEKKVVDKKILKPFCPLYIPKKPARYILEMPTKFENKIKLDEKINW
jgi:uncharacterized protein